MDDLTMFYCYKRFCLDDKGIIIDRKQEEDLIKLYTKKAEELLKIQEKLDDCNIKFIQFQSIDDVIVPFKGIYFDSILYGIPIITIGGFSKDELRKEKSKIIEAYTNDSIDDNDIVYFDINDRINCDFTTIKQILLNFVTIKDSVIYPNDYFMTFPECSMILNMNSFLYHFLGNLFPGTVRELISIKQLKKSSKNFQYLKKNSKKMNQKAIPFNRDPDILICEIKYKDTYIGNYDSLIYEFYFILDFIKVLKSLTI